MIDAAVTELLSLGTIAIGAIVLTVFLAAIVQASTGVGFGLLVAPVLVLIHPEFVPGTVLTLGLLVTGLAAIRELKHVNPQLLGAGLSGRIPGSIVGASATAALSPAIFGITFGLLILCAVLFSLLGPRIQPTVKTVGIAGLVSGFMGTLTSVGAPPMAIALQNASGPEMRATTSAFLLFGALVSIVSLWVFGVFDSSDMLDAVLLLPCAYLGFAASRKLVFHPLMERYLRPCVLALCVAMAAMLIVKSLAAL